MPTVKIPTAKLSDGYTIPMLGLGTYKSEAGQVYKAVCDAIDIGYRHLDCALVYDNEAEIGKAIKDKIAEGVVTRADLFITSKCWNTYRSEELRPKGLEKTLSDLGVDYVDLYLIHWPFSWKEGGALFPVNEDGTIPSTDIDYLDVWKSMEEYQKAGKARSIGVSNFNREQIERILKEGSVKPVVNQIEMHGYLQQEKLRAYCESQGIVVTAYCPLAGPYKPFNFEGPILMEHPIVKGIAAAHNKSVAQILLRFLVQRDIVVIPKSVTKERIQSNAEIFDFKLTQEEMDRLKTLDRGHRMVPMTPMKNHKYFPFGSDL